jgi:hypothetical protein
MPRWWGRLPEAGKRSGMDVGRAWVEVRNCLFWVVWEKAPGQLFEWRFPSEGQARYMAAVLALRPRRVPIPDSIRRLQL